MYTLLSDYVYELYVYFDHVVRYLYYVSLVWEVGN
jgi:hypothetical protein